MEFKDIVARRHAAKKFDGRKIEDGKVDALLDIIRMAPSSFNIQPWKIKVVTDQGTKDKLKGHSYGQEQISSCSHLLVFCADTDLAGLIDRIEDGISNAGKLDDSAKGYVGMMRGMASGMTNEQMKAWAQRQLYLALGNAVNGAESLGFDSCPMEGFDPNAYAKELGLPGNLVPTALCPIGYAADNPRPKARFSRGEVFF